MIHQIQNEKCSVQINQIGAEISSIKSIETGLEYLWQGDTSFWSSTAPVLFPIIGALKNGTYTHDGSKFTIPKHGFIRYNENLVILDKSENEITFSYASNEQLKKNYPFDFQFEITFSLQDNVLHVLHQITNKGTREMLFSLGGHPAFKCPLFPDEKYADYYIEFDQSQTLATAALSSNGLLTDDTYEVISNAKKIHLSEELFANDALIFRDIISKKVVLKSKNHNNSVTVTFTDFKDLAIWAKHKAPFVCIEPWLGITDHENTTGVLKEKEGIISLPVGEKYHAKFSIEIN
ncbi:MAG: galactose mutarotase-like enzyme [Salibacteraceae bacterium]|jgi:galactose mutarotase-like enzyme